MAELAESEPDPKRARILEAALVVCQRSGVYAARMEEVAALAQVSKGTLYRFFESKEDLFLATLIESYEESLRAVEIDPTSGPRERLVAVIEGLCTVLTAVAPRASVHYQAWGVVAGSPSFETRLHDFLCDFHRERDREFEEIVLAGQRAGVFRADVSAGALATGIGALLSGFIYRSAFDSVRANRQTLRACFDTLILEPLEIETSPGARPTREVDEHG